ncbi:hypothetical protein [Halomicronema hongdechloris]|uniref:hypothetical protein n=1 Tax=Halomicronema hongdechloris TaxID=1209493 RepID=UPI001651023A|nr:hypothetical protein [Halomicronema hongdechloris]
MTDPRARTTSHWAVSEECCKQMARKYGWTLREARRRLEANDPLTWECIYSGDAEFPKSAMDYSGGADDD